MTVEVRSIYAPSWKIIKSRLFLGVTASALAVIAFFGITSIDATEPSTLSRAPAPSSVEDMSARIDAMSSRPTMSYFVVGSEAEHDVVFAAQTSEAERRLANGGRQHLFAVVVVNSLETQSDSENWLEDLKTGWLLAGATDLTVTDLRAQ